MNDLTTSQTRNNFTDIITPSGANLLQGGGITGIMGDHQGHRTDNSRAGWRESRKMRSVLIDYVESLIQSTSPQGATVRTTSGTEIVALPIRVRFKAGDDEAFDRFKQAMQRTFGDRCEVRRTPYDIKEHFGNFNLLGPIDRLYEDLQNKDPEGLAKVLAITRGK